MEMGLFALVASFDVISIWDIHAKATNRGTDNARPREGRGYLDVRKSEQVVRSDHHRHGIVPDWLGRMYKQLISV